jgi:hypothetical protein
MNAKHGERENAHELLHIKVLLVVDGV